MCLAMAEQLYNKSWLHSENLPTYVIYNVKQSPVHVYVIIGKSRISMMQFITTSSVFPGCSFEQPSIHRMYTLIKLPTWC